MVVGVKRKQGVTVGGQLEFGHVFLLVYASGVQVNAPVIPEPAQFGADLGSRDARDVTAGIEFGVHHIAEYAEGQRRILAFHDVEGNLAFNTSKACISGEIGGKPLPFEFLAREIEINVIIDLVVVGAELAGEVAPETAIPELQIAGSLFFQQWIANLKQGTRCMQHQIFVIDIASAGVRGYVGKEFFDRGRPFRAGRREQQIRVVAHIVEHTAADARGISALLAAAVRVDAVVLESNTDFAGPVRARVSLHAEDSQRIDVGLRNKCLLAGCAEYRIRVLQTPNAGPVSDRNMRQGDAAFGAFVGKTRSHRTVAVFEHFDFVKQVVAESRRGPNALDPTFVEP